MALSAAGAAVGLWWDPLQLWCDAHAYPGALFALPEHDQNTPACGRMALFVPTPASRWTAENQTHAHVRYSATHLCRIRLWLVAPVDGAITSPPPTHSPICPLPTTLSTSPVHAADATGCLLLASPEAEVIEAVLVNGQVLPHVPDLDAVAAGWRCRPGAGYVLIKPGQPGAVSVTCVEKIH
jgi:hypothetical protein